MTGSNQTRTEAVYGWDFSRKRPGQVRIIVKGDGESIALDFEGGELLEFARDVFHFASGGRMMEAYAPDNGELVELPDRKV